MDLRFTYCTLLNKQGGPLLFLMQPAIANPIPSCNHIYISIVEQIIMDFLVIAIGLVRRLS